LKIHPPRRDGGFPPLVGAGEELQDEWEEETEDEGSDVLDVAKHIKEGSRKSERKRNLKQIQPFGFQIPSTQIDFVHTGSEDSDANGMHMV
jgi:hypothetical protein